MIISSRRGAALNWVKSTFKENHKVLQASCCHSWIFIQPDSYLLEGWYRWDEVDWIGSIIWGHVVESRIEALPRLIKKVGSLAVPSTHQPSANGGDQGRHRKFPPGHAALGKAEFPGATDHS
ncbi:hypothetical protein ABVK25_010075 [Lepraria finkii]|uniref:Uncharacterized protein n=1 Tax=Lepraria finkii TaxID=1340010 RepID=A0ABR4AVU9_9LECA